MVPSKVNTVVKAEEPNPTDEATPKKRSDIRQVEHFFICRGELRLFRNVLSINPNGKHLAHKMSWFKVATFAHSAFCTLNS